MEVRLLGPVEAAVRGQVAPLGGTKPRTLLAVLSLHHDQVVPAAQLVDAIWGTAPPATARSVLQTYVSTLRQTFSRRGAPDVIVTRPPGYLLRLQAGALDTDVFERLFADGRAAAGEGRYQEAVGLLREADAQWRGAALGGMAEGLLAGVAQRLDEMRLAATEERITAELALGRLDSACLELTELVARHPHRERLAAQLMLALSGLGRRSEALALYRRSRVRMIDDLGIEPGPELSAAHTRVLQDRVPRGAAAPTAGAARGPTAGPGGDRRARVEALRERMVGPPPAQLPPAPADFTARAPELAALRAALRPDSGLARLVVQTVVGAPGTGKSTLATRVGHEVAGRYPDGQLYADLGETRGVPVGPRDLLGRFLLALGEEHVPDTVEERSERYRTLLTGRRVLVVLDDAGSEEQIRPLLPGRSTCAVLVTSRRPLSGLSSVRLTELGMFSSAQGRELLCRIVGADRVDGEPDAARRIVHHCGGLPLALRIAGIRLAHRGRWPLSLLADRLADERRRLDELSVGDQDVRRALGSSYRAVDPQARAALRMLGALGAVRFHALTLATALCLPEQAAERVIERLVDARLVDCAGVDRLGRLRYGLDDLVRLYARERAEIEEGSDRPRRVPAPTRTSTGRPLGTGRVRRAAGRRGAVAANAVEGILAES